MECMHPRENSKRRIFPSLLPRSVHMNWPRGLYALGTLDPGLGEKEKSLRTVESRAPGHLLFLAESLLVCTPFLCVMASWMLSNALGVGQGAFASL